MNAKSAEEEERLMAGIAGFFGEVWAAGASREMKNSGGFWRKVIRCGYGELVERAMGELRYQFRTGGRPSGTWAQRLNFETRIYTGCGSWEEAFRRANETP